MASRLRGPAIHVHFFPHARLSPAKILDGDLPEEPTTQIQRPPPTAPNAPAHTSTTPTGTPQVALHTWDTLQPIEAAKMIEWEKDNLAKGRITAEEATQRFDALGATPEQRIITEDTRTDEQRLMEANFPAASESDFLLRMYPPGHEPPVIPKAVRDFENNARGWMADAGLTREHGNSVVTIISKMLQHTHAMTAEQRETYKEQENEKLRALFGGQDKLNKALEPAKRMIHEVEQKRPGLKEFVCAHGDNALFVAQLIQAARIYHARRNGR